MSRGKPPSVYQGNGNLTHCASRRERDNGDLRRERTAKQNGGFEERERNSRCTKAPCWVRTDLNLPPEPRGRRSGRLILLGIVRPGPAVSPKPAPRSMCVKRSRKTYIFRDGSPQRSILQGHLVRVRSLTDPVVLSLLTQEM